MKTLRFSSAHWAELTSELQTFLRSHAEEDGVEIIVDGSAKGADHNLDEQGLTDGRTLAETIVGRANCVRSCDAKFNQKDGDWRKKHGVQPSAAYYKFVIAANNARIKCLEACEKKFK